MTTDEYIQQRLDQQISWYERKAKINKFRYRGFKLLVIVFSVSIPFFTGLITGESYWLKVTVGLAGVLIAFCEGVLSLFKYQENWLEYRSTAEKLRREKILFLTQTGPYASAPILRELVERAEGIMSSENQSWVKIQAQQQDEEDEEEEAELQ